ncbi:M48 family metallopeptidase [Maridesulfovibrio sp. FT414]|uniref:M48 family metallopeptidase n=1 Tax=Maridesulfovibrio sp. FT414 TaxID=2979469 RepID=UPI003D807FF6
MPKHKDIEYSLIRSNRKTASLHIERDGSVTLMIPEKLSDSDADRIIESKLYWIYKSLAEWEDLNATKVNREFVSGEGFLYLGRSYRLKFVEEQHMPLMLRNGYFCLRTSKRGNQIEPHEAFKEFYRAKGKQRIHERVDLYRKMLAVKPSNIRIMELKHRWASCSRNGALNFHWKCMMAPLLILDYIVVHELAHLIHPRHTSAFWNEVDKVLPDYFERKEWLKKRGAEMDL